MEGERFFEAAGERDGAVFVAFALGDSDAAGVKVEVVEADVDELGDANAGVEQRDQDDVAAAPGDPDRFVVAADLGLARHERQRLGLPLDVHVELGVEVTEDVFEVCVVRALAAEMFREISRLALRWGPSCPSGLVDRGRDRGGCPCRDETCRTAARDSTTAE